MSGVNEDNEVIMADNEAYDNFGQPTNYDNDNDDDDDDDDDDDGDEIIMHTLLANNRVHLNSHNPECFFFQV